MTFRLVVFAIATLILLLGGGILWLNAGNFIYTQDDPYIHLALAENLARGHYGINPGEASAPSSSILYPMLLAASVWLGLDPFAPLLINLASLFAAVGLLRAILRRAFGPVTAAESGRLGVLVFALALGLNFVGVAFTGLGHSPHIMLSLAVVYGLILAFEEGRIAWWLLAALVLGPLVRYEGLGITASALLVLALRGRWRPAAATAVATLMLVGLHAWWLHRLGLPILPSSVMVKSVVAWSVADRAGPSLIITLIGNLYMGLTSERGIVLVIMAWIVAWRAARTRPSHWNSAESGLAAFAVLAAGAHLFAGRFGWLDRYELYIMATVALAGIYLWRRPLKRAIEGPKALALAMLVIAAVGWPYLRTTALTPLAANNIYQQQFQMHRFAAEFYKGAVAVNDLGLVAYDNENYVLDLWGLGLEEVRRVGLGRLKAEAIAELTARYDVGLVMIYAHWYKGRLPPGWRTLGRLYLGGPKVATDHDPVTFFATTDDQAERLTPLLRKFADTLPPGVRFELGREKDE